MAKAITISLSPNAQKRDILKALRIFCAPWYFINGSSIKQLEQWFRNYFHVSHAVSFNSGRAGLYAILRTLGIQKGDEVLLQAFTCVVVPDAVVTLGAKPVYVDILDNLTMDPSDLEKKITENTKAILVQHTFGIASDMKSLMKIAKKHNIAIVEDVAHTIGGMHEGRKLGTFGIASFFSFGRDKAFSSVFGGMVISNNEQFGKKLRAYQKQLPFPSFFWVAQQLFHPVAFFVVLLFYTIGVGKIILFVLQRLNFLSFPVSATEKKGLLDRNFIRKMPNALASLALFQLRRVREFNSHRESVVHLYNKSLSEEIKKSNLKRAPLLRYPVFMDKSDAFIQHMKKHKIYLGNWYRNVIDPVGSNLATVHYKKGSCRNAEKLAAHVVNLPTHPTMTYRQAQAIVALINKYD